MERKCTCDHDNDPAHKVKKSSIFSTLGRRKKSSKSNLLDEIETEKIESADKASSEEDVKLDFDLEKGRESLSRSSSGRGTYTSNRKVTSALSAVGENGRRSPLSSLGMEEYSPETKPRRDTFSPEPEREVDYSPERGQSYSPRSRTYSPERYSPSKYSPEQRKYSSDERKGSTMKRIPKRRDSFGEDSRSEDSEQEEHIKVVEKVSVHEHPKDRENHSGESRYSTLRSIKSSFGFRDSKQKSTRSSAGKEEKMSRNEQRRNSRASATIKERDESPHKNRKSRGSYSDDFDSEYSEDEVDKNTRKSSSRQQYRKTEPINEYSDEEMDDFEMYSKVRKGRRYSEREEELKRRDKYRDSRDSRDSRDRKYTDDTRRRNLSSRNASRNNNQDDLVIQSADEFDSEYVDDEEELSLKNSEKSSEVSGEHSRVNSLRRTFSSVLSRLSKNSHHQNGHDGGTTMLQNFTGTLDRKFRNSKNKLGSNVSLDGRHSDKTKKKTFMIFTSEGGRGFIISDDEEVTGIISYKEGKKKKKSKKEHGIRQKIDNFTDTLKKKKKRGVKAASETPNFLFVNKPCFSSNESFDIPGDSVKQIQDTIRWQHELEENEEARNKKIDLKKSSSMRDSRGKMYRSEVMLSLPYSVDEENEKKERKRNSRSLSRNSTSSLRLDRSSMDQRVEYTVHRDSNEDMYDRDRRDRKHSSRK